jgi:hypothetical protein
MKDPQKLKECEAILRKLEAIALVKGVATCKSVGVKFPSNLKGERFTYIAYMYNYRLDKSSSFYMGDITRDVAIQRIAMLNHREQENILNTDGQT